MLICEYIRTVDFSGKPRVTELIFEVPGDHSKPSSGILVIFPRSFTKHELAIAYINEDKACKRAQKLWFIFLDGGPGKSNPTPQASPMAKLILDREYEIPYMDQRRMSLSTPISAETIPLHSDAQKASGLHQAFPAQMISLKRGDTKLFTQDSQPELKK